MAQHHRRIHDEGADAAVGVIVDVAAADPDRVDLDLDVARPDRQRQVDVAQAEFVLLFENHGAHRFLRR